MRTKYYDTLEKKDGRTEKLTGRFGDFFPLIGDINLLSSHIEPSNRYTVYWMDDHEDDFREGLRRLSRVTFSKSIASTTEKTENDDQDKTSYNMNFEAKGSKKE